MVSELYLLFFAVCADFYVKEINDSGAEQN